MNKKYNSQRRRAAQRNIEWLFTYDTWLAWWENTGKLSERGKAGDQYCMGRPNDAGPYSPTNAICITNRENARTKDHSKTSAALKSKPVGWDKETRDKQRVTKQTDEYKQRFSEAWKSSYTQETADKKSKNKKKFWNNLTKDEYVDLCHKISEGMK